MATASGWGRGQTPAPPRPARSPGRARPLAPALAPAASSALRSSPADVSAGNPSRACGPRVARGEKVEPGRGRSLSAEESCVQFAPRWEYLDLSSPPVLQDLGHRPPPPRSLPLLMPPLPRGPFSGSHIFQSPLSEPLTRTLCHHFTVLPCLLNRFL